jgi:hypothetical protein
LLESKIARGKLIQELPHLNKYKKMIMLLDLTEQLRNRLADFKKSNLFIEYASFRQDIRMIEVMVNLSELAWENKFKLENHHYHWFKGWYLLANSFNGEWKVIPELYSNIVDIMVDKRFVDI